MSLAPLDERIALLVVDLQVGTAARMQPDVLATVVERADALARAFRERSLPVVLATVHGAVPGRSEMTKAYGMSTQSPEGARLLEGLSTASDDVLVSRAAWSPFVSTGLQQTLGDVTQLVIVGVATSIGVESAARDAYALGYSVVVATDAVTDFRPDVAAAHLAEIFPLMSELATTDEVIAALR